MPENTSLCSVRLDSKEDIYSPETSNILQDKLSKTANELSNNVSTIKEREKLINNDIDVINSIPQELTEVKVLSKLPVRTPVDFVFSDVNYSVRQFKSKGSKSLLTNLSGEFHSGELIALMGPSGAGKSTLLNVLAGCKNSRVTGEVLVNGAPRNLRQFRKLSCYIMQDNELLPYLTVYEAMHVSAGLKLDDNLKYEERQVVVQEILETLGLVECCNTMTSKLSGGQRKLLSIAQELVSNPPIMFFDEPTSGLDSSARNHCISLLKSLSQGGRLIVCSIHQPSAKIFEMFDQLYMLADGQCIYRGSIPSLIPFLSSVGLDCPTYHNPSDYVMEVACGEHGDSVPKLVRAMSIVKQRNLLYAAQNQTSNETDLTPNYYEQPADVSFNETSETNSRSTSRPQDLKDEILHTQISYLTSGYTQFQILLKRTFSCIIRDSRLTKLRLAAQIIVGLLMGTLYYKMGNDASKVFNNAGYIFTNILFLMFTAMMPSLLTFPLERAVFVREHLNYWYSLRAFYFAKMVADIPVQIIHTILYLVIVYFVTDQPRETWRFSVVVMFGILTSLVAQSLGLLIGALFKVKFAVVVGPIFCLLMTIFSGFFVSFSAMPSYLRWLTYLCYTRYSFEGTVVAIYGYEREKLACSKTYCHYRSPTLFLDTLEMRNANMWLDAAALVVIFVIFRCSVYVVLKLQLRSNH